MSGIAIEVRLHDELEFAALGYGRFFIGSEAITAAALITEEGLLSPFDYAEVRVVGHAGTVLARWEAVTASDDMVWKRQHGYGSA